jgi:hypothetical protein
MSRETDNKAIVGRWFEGFWANAPAANRRGLSDRERAKVASPPFSATQPSRRECLFLPHSGHRPATKTVQAGRIADVLYQWVVRSSSVKF